eukprot:9091132-Ditylum_brightwellii.AAC.1
MKIQDRKLHLVEDVAAQLDTPLDFDFSSDYEFLYALFTGYLLSDDLAERLGKIQKMTKGIHTETEREVNSLGVVNEVVGMAIFKRLIEIGTG